MGRINNTLKYAFDQIVSLTDYVIGTDSATSAKATKNYMILDMFRSFQAFSGVTYMTLNDIDDPTYDYYAGCYMGDEWIVFRYLKTDLNQKEQATEGLNFTIKSLDEAWANRNSLIYT